MRLILTVPYILGNQQARIRERPLGLGLRN